MPVLTSARLNILRLNAGRLNYVIPGRVNTTPIVITIEGLPVHARVRKASLAIRDILNAPNLCTFTIEGAAPSVGQEVRVGLRDLAPSDVLFGGTIDTVAAFYEARPVNRAWAVTCQDYTFGLNRRKVRIRYGQQAAHLIALDLLARYAPSGYTGAAVVQPLPTVTGGIDFTEDDLTECFARLAQRIGGYWYVDYEKAIHLFLTEATEAPDPIVPGGRLLLNEPPITQATDLTQIRTRVYVEGGGSQARVPASPGATQIGVVDANWYAPAGGLVVAGPQRIAYTGKDIIGGPAAPVATALAGAGNLAGGPYYYKYSFLAGSEEGLLSIGSAAVTLPLVAAPGSAMAATVTRDPTYVAAPPYFALGSQIPVVGAGGLSPGTYEWASTYLIGAPVTETTPTWSTPISSSNSSWWCEWLGLPAPPAPPTPHTRRIYRTSANGARATARMVVDLGATAPGFTDSTADADRQMGISPPSSNTTATGPIIAPGRIDWVVTFATAAGETLASPATTVTLTEGTTSVTLSSIPTSADARVTQRKIYRSKRDLPGTYYLETTINDTTTTTYVSSKTDAQLGAALGGYTAGQTGQIALTNLAAGPVGTNARNLYRTEAGGALFKLVVKINDNTTTTYTDNKADSALGATAEGGTAFQVLTGIPASGAGAVLYDILAGDEVNILVRCDDVAAQSALAALEGAPSDGIVEHFIQDRRLALPMATATGNADLVLFARPIQKLTYATHDRKTAAGKTVSVNLPPLALAGAFTIQSVTIDQLDASPNLPPRYTVEASSVRWSLEDVLRRLQLEA